MSTVRQENKATVWRFWQELNQAPHRYEGLIDTYISDDIAWQGPTP